MVAHVIWEREAQVRAVALGKPGKTWESWADSTFPLAGNWSKIGVDHMFDHNWKISYPGVAQLVARLLWECRGAIRDGSGRNDAKPCDACVCGTFPGY